MCSQAIILALMLTACAFTAQSGEVVVASSFGWSADDATACLQRALDSGADNIVVDRQAGDWIVCPLFLTNRHDLVVIFEDGVVVHAKKNEFRQVTDALLTLVGCSNVVLRGAGDVRLSMNKADYADGTKYQTGDWRHTLAIYGSEQIRVENLTLAESGGDGVYVHGVSDLHLEDVVSVGHYRQGMSVISVNGLTAKRCRFAETRGVPPQSGVDLEPNNWYEEMRNVVFEQCEFSGNAGTGLSLYLPSYVTNSPFFDVTLNDCSVMSNSQNGVLVALSAAESVRGRLRLEGCYVRGNANAPFCVLNASAEDGLAAEVVRCQFDARGSACTAAVDLRSVDGSYDFGRMHFADSSVVVDNEQTPIDFIAKDGLGLVGVDGIIKVIGDGGEKAFDIAEFAQLYPPRHELLVPFHPAKLDIGELHPVCEAPAESVNDVNLRWHCSFVQYVPAAGEYPICFKQTSLISGAACTWSFNVVDAVGALVDSFVCTKENSTYTLKVETPGVYRFTGYGGYSLINVRSGQPGFGFLADTPVELFRGNDLRFNFMMPVGARTIEIKLCPQEPGSAQLIAPDGKVVVDIPLQAVGSVISYDRPSVAKAEIWQVRFPVVKEDYQFQIGGDAVPVATPGSTDLVMGGSVGYSVADSFEVAQTGTRISLLGGWSAEDGRVAEEQYAPATPPGYPLKDEPHSRVIDAENGARREVPGNTRDPQKLDVMVCILCRPLGELKTPDQDVKIGLAVDRTGHLCLWHRYEVDGGLEFGWSPLSEKIYPDGTWVRVEVEMEYGGLKENELFALIKVDGSCQPTARGVRSPLDKRKWGPWYRLASLHESDDRRKIKSIDFVGAKVDDLVFCCNSVASQQSGMVEVDGIALSWFDEHGLPRDPTFAAPFLHGYTIGDMYDAGIDPYSERPFAVTEFHCNQSGSVHLEFNGYRGQDPDKYRLLYSEDPDFSKTSTMFEMGGHFTGVPNAEKTMWDGSLPVGRAKTGFLKVRAIR